MIDDITTSAIFQSYQKFDQKFPSRLGASLIGHECDRYLWLNFRWARKIKHPGKLLRLFETGQHEESRIIDNLRAAGVIVHDVDDDGEQFTFTGIDGHFVCKIDGACLGLLEAPKSWHVLEVKTANEKNFTEIKKKGVKVAKYQHFAQVQTAMALSGMDRAYYIVVNKNSDDLYAERVHYAKLNETDEAIMLLDRARSIIYAPTPPERIGGPAHYSCKWCDYYDACHQDLFPAMNCRTCCHVTPKPGPAWVCEKHSWKLSNDRQTIGCDDHLFIPPMINAKLSDFQSGECVVYTTMDDKRFCNAPLGGFPKVDNGEYLFIAASKNMAGKKIEEVARA